MSSTTDLTSTANNFRSNWYEISNAARASTRGSDRLHRDFALRHHPAAPAISFGQRLQLAVSRLHRGLIVIKCVVECGVRLPSKPLSKPLDSAAPASCQPAASPCGFIATAPASCSGSRFLGSVLLDHLSSLRASLTTRCRCRSDRNAKAGAKTGRRCESTTPTNPHDSCKSCEPCRSAPPIWRMVQVILRKDRRIPLRSNYYYYYYFFFYLFFLFFFFFS